jgi:excisionase family DNA binding protein
MYLDSMTKGELRALIIDTVKEALSSQRDTIEQTLKVTEEGLATVKQVCTHFQISKPTLYNWLKKGIIAKYKAGNGTRFKISEITKAMREYPSLFRSGYLDRRSN